MDADTVQRAEKLLQTCREAKITLATAESCTGGLIAGYLTEVAGSSDVFERGFVTYSNEAKHDCLGVPPQVIASCGAVSRAVAELMALGALNQSNADIAIAVTGVAGPGGGSEDKPVGTVHIAAAARSGARRHELCRFADAGRAQIRTDTVVRALKILQELAEVAEESVG